MPTVTQNLEGWDKSYDWSAEGEEWSAFWGSSEAQWFGSILPRIHRFLPADTVLEIAPGFGRWTRFLKDHARRLEVVDLSEKCIEACRRRFAEDSHITYHVNDGKSLDMIADGSVNFAFTYDSLVHVEYDVIESYLGQLSRKLRPGGFGYIHHSNAGQWAASFSAVRKLPHFARRTVHGLRIMDRQEWRALSMTAARFEKLARDAGLACVSQELVNWGGRRPIDCFSVFTRPDGPVPANRVEWNNRFMLEARLVKRTGSLYGSGDGVGRAPSRAVAPV